MIPTAGNPLREAIESRLRAAGCIAAREEADELLRAAPGGVPDDWLERRERGEPLAWITGRTVFCGLTLRVDPGVYVPRFQSEELARRAAALLPAGGRAADLCTGCGAVAAQLMTEVPSAAVVAVDIDPVAVECARGNGVDAREGPIELDLERTGEYDVVSAVPPYVPTEELRLLPVDVRRYEPQAALDGGADGLEIARRIVARAAQLLHPGGWLLIELGGDQDSLLTEDLERHGYRNLEPWYDAEDGLRGLAAQPESDR